MKEHKIIESMDQLFSNFEKVDMKSLDNFLQEILKLFSYLQEKLNSKDEAEKREALELAEQLQNKLSGLAEKAYAASGLTPEKVKQVLSNPKNFKPEEWSAIQKLELDMNHHRTKITP